MCLEMGWTEELGQAFTNNQGGVVFEKDLGDDTATAITTIETFDPDASWGRAQ